MLAWHPLWPQRPYRDGQTPWARPAAQLWDWAGTFREETLFSALSAGKMGFRRHAMGGVFAESLSKRSQHGAKRRRGEAGPGSDGAVSTPRPLHLRCPVPGPRGVSGPAQATASAILFTLLPHYFFPLSWIIPINMQACCYFSHFKRKKASLESTFFLLFMLAYFKDEVPTQSSQFSAFHSL